MLPARNDSQAELRKGVTCVDTRTNYITA